MTSLGAGPPGGKQLKPIVAQDAQTQLDECSGPGVAGMPNLRSSDPLWGGAGGSPPSLITLGVRVCVCVCVCLSNNCSAWVVQALQVVGGGPKCE